MNVSDDQLVPGAGVADGLHVVAPSAGATRVGASTGGVWSAARARAAVLRMEEVLRSQRYSQRTTETYVAWVLRFFGYRLRSLAAAEDADAVRAFLSALAIRRHVSA